jgi:hypothetical protein
MDALKRKSIYKLIAILLLTVLCIGGAVGGMLARYLRSGEQGDVSASGSFYFYSDLLRTGAGSYDVADWRVNGITFALFNWSTENPALISGTDISYKIDLPRGWDVKSVYNGTEQVSLQNGCYTLKAHADGTAAQHTVNIIYTGGGNPDDTVTVAVQALSPFETTLTANFHPIGAALPDYTVTDGGNYLLVAVESNAFEGNFELSWTPAALSPDNSNAWMREWVDTVEGTILLQSNTRYELIFFKNQVRSYAPIEGSGTRLEIGGAQ